MSLSVWNVEHPNETLFCSNLLGIITKKDILLHIKECDDHLGDHQSSANNSRPFSRPPLSFDSQGPGGGGGLPGRSSHDNDYLEVDLSGSHVIA